MCTLSHQKKKKKQKYKLCASDTNIPILWKFMYPSMVSKQKKQKTQEITGVMMVIFKKSEKTTGYHWCERVEYRCVLVWCDMSVIILIHCVGCGCVWVMWIVQLEYCVCYCVGCVVSDPSHCHNVGLIVCWLLSIVFVGGYECCVGVGLDMSSSSFSPRLFFFVAVSSPSFIFFCRSVLTLLFENVVFVPVFQCCVHFGSCW